MNSAPNRPLRRRERLLIAGAGEFGREVWAWAADAGQRAAGFLDDREGALLGLPCDGEILGSIRGYEPREEDRLLVAIAEPAARLRVVEELEARGARFATLIHPTAILAPYSGLGAGSIVCPRATISTNTRLGRQVHVNIGCMVGHDVEIADGCTLSPHVVLSGHVRLERGVFIGSCACLLPHVVAREGCVVGAGCVVLRDVAPGTTVAGVPGRELTKRP